MIRFGMKGQGVVRICASAAEQEMTQAEAYEDVDQQEKEHETEMSFSP